jgi:hypothetical protein
MNRIQSSAPPNPSQIDMMEVLNGVVQETMRVHASGKAHSQGMVCVALTGVT